MEQLKALFDAVVAYCVETPFHAAVLVGIALLTLGAVVALIVVGVKGKKTSPDQAQERTSPATEPTENPVETVEETIEETVEETVENPVEIPKEESVEEPTEEPAEEPTVEPVEEPAEEPVEIPTETEESTEERTEESTKEPAQETVAEEKPENTEEIETSSQEQEETIKTTDKEDVMLLDELKDINTEIDFYEEDELDKMARYSGKWAICRVVIGDSANEDAFFFELRSTKGEQLLSSEEYTSYNSALRGIETHKSNVLRNHFRILPTQNGGYTFKLLSGKGMLLCMGNSYPTKAECEQAVESIKRFARTAFIDENIQDVVVKVPEETDEVLPPLPDGHKGKWVIDCRTLENGERAYYFELFSEKEECLLTSEDYTSYVGTINSIQTHKTNIKNGNFRISLTKQGDYTYKLLNGNGQILCLGDHYRTKRLCEYAVDVLKAYAADAPVLTDPDLMQ